MNSTQVTIRNAILEIWFKSQSLSELNGAKKEQKITQVIGYVITLVIIA